MRRQANPEAAAPALGPEPERWARLRARFPVLARKAYLNSCSYGALSEEVARAVQQYLQDRLEKGVDWDDWVAHSERLRASLAALLGAAPDEVALTASASAGLNAIASALSFEPPRNRVVITDLEFPTNAQIWYAQERRGAQVVRLPAPEGFVPPEAFEAAVDERTVLVATSHVSYRNGAKADVPAIVDIAHRHGALVLIDDFQSAGTTRLPPNALGADLVVGGTYKYLLGTAGVAFLYARAGLLERLVPTVTGWFAQADVFAMDVTAYRPSPTARRFEAGTPPVLPVYAADAGIGIVREVGLADIEARIRELTEAIKREARACGLRLATPADPSRHGAMIAIKCTRSDELVSRLLAEDIVTSHRDGNLRVAPHFYNDPADVERLFRALRKHRDLLA